MGLEDVPEMQLVIFDYDYKGFYRPFQKNKDGTFNGKFILLKAHPEGRYNAPALRLFIYSEKSSDSHLDIAPHFTQRMYKKYEINPYKITFTPISGGMIKVTDSEMIFSKKSESFGEYDKNKTKEIAQRYCAENLLDLKVSTI